MIILDLAHIKGLIAIYEDTFPRPGNQRTVAEHVIVDNLKEKELVAPGKTGLVLTDRGEAYLRYLRCVKLPKLVTVTTHTWEVPK